MRISMVTALSMLLAATPVMAADGMVNVPSAFGVEETADRLESVLIEKGMTVFDRIRHSEAASNAGIELRETELVIFGNPKVGSLLMQCQPSVAIDLPQKALIWRDGDSKVWISYNDPGYLKERHDITGCDEVLSKIEKTLADITETAASEAGDVLPVVHSGDKKPATQAMAGQMCPEGSHVIGFDATGNIICTAACGNGVLNPGEACDDGNTDSGDGCSANCQRESVVASGEKEKPVVETGAATQGSPSSIPEPVISEVKPKSVVWGSSEVNITISGTGFYDGSVVIFQGSTYKPLVNQAGTQLDVTLITENLAIGAYAIKVSNGPGLENTRKRALAVY